MNQRAPRSSHDVSQDTLQGRVSTMMSLASENFTLSQIPVQDRDYISSVSTLYPLSTSQSPFPMVSNKRVVHNEGGLVNTQQSKIGNGLKKDYDKKKICSLKNGLCRQMLTKPREIWSPNDSEISGYNDVNDLGYSRNRADLNITEDALSKSSNKILPMDRPHHWESKQKSMKQTGTSNIIAKTVKRMRSVGYQENSLNDNYMSEFKKGGTLAQHPLSKITIENGKLDAISFRPIWKKNLTAPNAHRAVETIGCRDSGGVNQDDIQEVEGSAILHDNDEISGSGSKCTDRYSYKELLNRISPSPHRSLSLPTVNTRSREDDDSVGSDCWSAANRNKIQDVGNKQMHLGHKNNNSDINRSNKNYYNNSTNNSFNNDRQKDFRSPGSSSKSNKCLKKIKAKPGSLKATYQRLQRNIAEKECRMLNVEYSLNDPQDPRNKALFYVDLCVLDDKEMWPYRIIRSCIVQIQKKNRKYTRLDNDKIEIHSVSLDSKYAGNGIKESDLQTSICLAAPSLLVNSLIFNQENTDSADQNQSRCGNGNNDYNSNYKSGRNTDYVMDDTLINTAERKNTPDCDQYTIATILADRSPLFASSSLTPNGSPTPKMALHSLVYECQPTIYTGLCSADDNLLAHIIDGSGPISFVERTVRDVDINCNGNCNYNNNSNGNNNVINMVDDNEGDIVENFTLLEGMHVYAYFKANNFETNNKILARGSVIRLYDPELLPGDDEANVIVKQR